MTGALPGGADPLLRLRGVSLGFGRTTVLSGVDLDIGAGEAWFIVGPNGQGKSTLLAAMLGLLEPQAGSVWRDPARAGPAQTGVVPQRLELDPRVRTTVEEFVSGGFAGLRRSAAQRRGALAAALRDTGLADLAGRELSDLSGGQRQRAVVARALVREPSLLVVDEPTTGLDASITAALLELLREDRARRGTTLLFVGHDLPVARRHATHAALVNAGRVRSGAAAQILTPAGLREAYGVLDVV